MHIGLNANPLTYQAARGLLSAGMNRGDFLKSENGRRRGMAFGEPR